MHATLAEAAALLHKSERQLRYMMQQGKLTGVRVGNRWMIPRDQLPVDGRSIESDARRADRATELVGDAARAAAPEHVRRAARVAEDVLQAAPPGARFSVRSLQAWRVLSPLHREVVVRLGAEAPASQALRRALRHLTLGAHRFFREDKANAYRAARDDVSESVFHLLIEDVPDADPWLDRLENDAMAALTGLLRRYDQRRPG